jgi:predicted nucleic acid-binding protein
MFLNVGNALAANRRMKAFELQPLVTADNMEQLLRTTRVTKAWEVTLDLFEMYMASAESLLGNGFWSEAITAMTTAHTQLVTFESEEQFSAAEQLPKSVPQEILVAMGQALRERQCLEVQYSNDMADAAQLAAAAQTQAQLNTIKTRLRMLLQQQQQQQQLVGMNDDDVDDDDSYRKACKLIDDVDPWDAPFWNSNRHRLSKATVSVRHTVRAVIAFDH